MKDESPLSSDSSSFPARSEAAGRSSLLWWLFATVLAVNLLFFSGTVRSADGGTMLAVTRSLALRGDTAVPEGSVGSRGRDGRLYAQYGPACSVAALPLFLVGHGLARAARLGPERTAEVEEAAVALFNPLVVALTAVILALAALELGVGWRWAAGGGLLGAFGTGLFVQMKDFNSEPLTALLFLGAFYVLLRQRGAYPLTPFLKGGGINVEENRRGGGLRGGGGLALVGALAGAAILARPANALGAALLAAAGTAAIVGRRKAEGGRGGVASRASRVASGGEGGDHASGAGVVWRLVCLVAPVLVGVGLYGWYNYARFGNPLDTGYPPITFSYPVVRGLWLQLFSAERGVVWYDPVVLLAPAGLAWLWRRGERGAVALAAALVAGYVLLYSLYAQAPAGGHSMGQRFLLIVAPLLVLAAVPALERAGRGASPPAPSPAHAAWAYRRGGSRAAPGVTGECRRPWTGRLVAAIIAISVLVQLPLVWVNPSYYYALRGAEQERTGTAARGERVGEALVVRSWALAVEVTREALTRPGGVRSLAEHTQPATTATEMLPGPRSWHVPYCWWALAWAYGVPGRWVLVAVLVNLLLAAFCACRLARSLALSPSGQPSPPSLRSEV